VPYYITSAIIRHLLESDLRPHRLVLTVQLEVAERLIAKPGDMSLLSVSAQFYAATRIVMRLKSGAFWPRPEVDSAVVRMDTYSTPSVPVPSDAIFFRVAKAGFSQKRKQLKNSLASGLNISNPSAMALLAAAEIDPRRRSETLTLAEWAALSRAYAQLEHG
jgi:16S rRNA (adenine1518-N6/adenine1519-N6)-dimethyltransferase